MNSKLCAQCMLDKHVKDFYKYTECEECHCKRGLKRYLENKLKYQINSKFVLKKIETNYNSNKIIDIKFLQKNSLPMLHWKTD